MMTFLPQLDITDGECEHCKKAFYVLAHPPELVTAKFCPFCGLDEDGARGLTNSQLESTEGYCSICTPAFIDGQCRCD